MAVTPYTSWVGHGALCAAPPFTFSDVKAYMFGLEASKDAINALVSELLAPAAQGVVKYTCPAGCVLVTFTDVARCASTVDAVGWLPVRECALWVPLVEETLGALPRFRIVLWTPYIFINSDLGLVSGREIWGWPKEMASIAVATDAPDQPASFSASTTIFRTFDASQPGAEARLISVNGTQPLAAPGGTWQSGSAVVDALFDALLPGLSELLPVPLQPVLPVIALKEVRDSFNPTAACFRALVNAPCRLTAFRGGSLLTDTFKLTIETCQSHAITSDLFGTAPLDPATPISVKWAAALDIDFTAESGSVIG